MTDNGFVRVSEDRFATIENSCLFAASEKVYGQSDITTYAKSGHINYALRHDFVSNAFFVTKSCLSL